MKLTLTVLLALSGLIFPTKAQTQIDQAKILQQCLDLPELQQYYARDASGFKAVNIMQHGVSFPGNLNVSKGRQPVRFLSKKEVNENQVKAYFLFHLFNVSSDSAAVSFVYQYNQTDLLVVNLTLQKTEDTWSVTESKVEKRS